MPLTYAPAAQADAETIFELCRELILRYEDPEEMDLDRALQWTRRKIHTHISQYTCVFFRGQPAGFFRLCDRDGQRELDDLFILPPFRNRGIGTAVVQKCCRESRLPLFLYVFTQNTGAIRLYQRLGFRVTEQVSGTRCLMRREDL